MYPKGYITSVAPLSVNGLQTGYAFGFISPMLSLTHLVIFLSLKPVSSMSGPPATPFPLLKRHFPTPGPSQCLPSSHPSPTPLHNVPVAKTAYQIIPNLFQYSRLTPSPQNYYAHIAIGQEFGQGPTGMACLFFMTAGTSAGWSKRLASSKGFSPTCLPLLLTVGGALVLLDTGLSLLSFHMS